MRPNSPISYVPIEARLRNARRLITTVPPIAILAAAAMAVCIGFTPSPTEVARTGTAAAPVTPAVSERTPTEVHSDQHEPNSIAGSPRPAPIAR